MVAVRHRCPQPVVPCHPTSVLGDVVVSERFPILIDRVELLDIQQEHLVNDVLVIRLVISIRDCTNIGVVGQIGSRLVEIARSILRVGHDGALRHRLDHAELVRAEAVEEALLLVIRRSSQDMLRIRRIAAEPFYLPGGSAGIEPGAHIAIAPVVRAVLAPPTVAPVRACPGIRAGRGVIRHRILEHPV